MAVNGASKGCKKNVLQGRHQRRDCGVFNLQEATADHHAISQWGWVKDNTVLKSGNNTVSNNWKIQSDQKSRFHVEAAQTKIYWLQDPSHAQHPVTMGWADNKYAASIKPQQLFAGSWRNSDRQSFSSPVARG